MTRSARTITYALVIFGAVILAPFFPDNLLPPHLCKLVLAAETAALVAVLAEGIFRVVRRK